MPAYEQPIRFHLPPSAPKKDSVAAMIKFKCSAEEADRATAFLNSLVARGIIEHYDVKAYDSSIGGPVLYFP